MNGRCLSARCRTTRIGFEVTSADGHDSEVLADLLEPVEGDVSQVSADKGI
jgi:hypothetical protein